LVRVCLLCLVLALGAASRPSTPEDDLCSLGPGVTPPKARRKPNAPYTAQAKQARAQGTVLLELIVDEQGRPSGIAVVSPLGFGLDQAARRAVERLEFEPGRKEGRPVKARTTVEVNFRLPGFAFASKAERRRSDFNKARHDAQLDDLAGRRDAVERMRGLSNRGFAPAMHAVALWMEEGRLLPKDPQGALRLYNKSAAQDYGPAIYELGRHYIAGDWLPGDSAKGLKMLHEAAVLGSKPAQLQLGLSYEAGAGVPKDEERARHYFRQCAAQGEPACQFRVAASLLAAPGRRERDLPQAVAWLELAASQGDARAATRLAKERPMLTEEQAAQARKWKDQLARKQP
jgi:TonB family protein